MNILFDKSFEKDIRKLKGTNIPNRIKKVIGKIENTNSVDEIPNIKKIKGYTKFYRIKIGKYRIGVETTEKSLIFLRCLHRKDIYKHFPR
jgi:mRNA interferase RelE/StbE